MDGFASAIRSVRGSGSALVSGEVRRTVSRPGAQSARRRFLSPAIRDLVREVGSEVDQGG